MLEFDPLIAEFRRELPWHLRCSDKVAEQSAYDMQMFIRHQSEPFPGCFTYQHVMVWLLHLRSTPPYRRNAPRRAVSTINNHLKSLKRFSKWAVARGYLESNPISHLRGLPEQEVAVFPPSVEDVAAMLAAAEEHGATEELRVRNYAIMCVLVDNGPRADELVRMDLLDVVDLHGELRPHTVIHGKGSRDRLMRLSPLVKRALERYLPLRRPLGDERALWVTEQGARMEYVALRGVVKRIAGKADVKVSLHDFRRFALGQMWLSGIDQVSGMTLSGHRKVEVYMRYLRGTVALRALEQHEKHSPLEKVLAGD